MWQVTATGSEGRTYVYLVDAPDYAPEGVVFDSACRQHAQERKQNWIKETLDIRPDRRIVQLVCPAEEWHRHQEIMNRAKDRGVKVSATDIVWTDGQPTIDGMDAEEWLSAM